MQSVRLAQLQTPNLNAKVERIIAAKYSAKHPQLKMAALKARDPKMGKKHQNVVHIRILPHSFFLNTTRICENRLQMLVVTRSS